MNTVVVFPTWKCGLDCPYCLAPTTKIRMDRGGTKQIHNLKVGDRLRTLDESNDKAITTVTAVMSRMIYTDALRICFKSGSRIVTTGEHPFKVGKDWVEAKDLKVGDEVIRPINILKGHGGKAGIGSQITKLGFLPLAKHKNREPQRIMAKKRMVIDNPMYDPEVSKRSHTNRVSTPSKLETWFESKIIYDLPVYYVGDGRMWLRKVIEISDYGYFGRDETYMDEMNAHYSKNNFESRVFLFKGRTEQEVKNVRSEIKQFIVNGDPITEIEPYKVRKDRGLKVYNITCEPYPWYIAEELLVHNCRYEQQEDNKSIVYLGSEYKYLVRKELSSTEWLKLLETFSPASYDFSGGEPLRHGGIVQILNGLSKWTITSNTLHFKDSIDLSRCAWWTASFHLHINENAKKLFMENIVKIRKAGVGVGVTLVARPEGLATTLSWANKFASLGYRVNIHPYYDDKEFSWHDYPNEMRTLMDVPYLRYDNRLFSYDGMSGNGPCKAGENYFMVGPDGKVFRCLTDMLFGRKPIGNKNRQGYLLGNQCDLKCYFPCDWAYGKRT